MLRRYACGLIFLAAGLAACGDGGGSPTEPRPARAVLALSLPASTVEPGQTVPAKLTLLNDGDEPLPLTFGSSNCQVDLVVESGGATVWSLSSNAICLQNVITVTLQPRQVIVYDMEWDQTRNGGGPAQPGTYTMRAVLLANDRPQSTPVMLTIRSST